MMAAGKGKRGDWASGGMRDETVVFFRLWRHVRRLLRYLHLLGESGEGRRSAWLYQNDLGVCILLLLLLTTSHWSSYVIQFVTLVLGSGFNISKSEMNCFCFFFCLFCSFFLGGE